MTIKIERADGGLFPYQQFTRFRQKVEGPGQARTALVTPEYPAIVKGNSRTVEINELSPDLRNTRSLKAMGYVFSEGENGQVRFWKAVSDEEPLIKFDGLKISLLPKRGKT